MPQSTPAPGNKGNTNEENFYNTGFADFYDLILYGEMEHNATETEIDFFHWVFGEYCRIDVDNVLDAGCGSGRFLVPFVKSGLQVTGIDTSEEMLGACRKKALKHGIEADLVKMSISELDSESFFDAVICVDSVLNYTLDKRKTIEILKKFNKTLVSQGVLVLEAWNVYNHIELVNKESSYVNKDGAAIAKIKESNTFDNATGILSIDLEIEAGYNDELKKFRHSEKMVTILHKELERMAKTAGFVDIKLFSGFDFSDEKDPKGESVILVAMKA